jgi:hypothetical protein
MQDDKVDRRSAAWRASAAWALSIATALADGERVWAPSLLKFQYAREQFDAFYLDDDGKPRRKHDLMGESNAT